MYRAGLWVAVVLALVGSTAPAHAHCDTIEGPVVTAARQALENGDLAPVLRWVPADAEREVAAAFEQARKVRALSPEAAGLADTWFFETVVRLHRAGEGVPFTGLAAPGTPVAAPILAVDAALASGRGEDLARQAAAEVESAVRERFARVAAAKAHAGESVERGRELVAAYVELTHFAERLHELVAEGAGHGAHGEEGGRGGAHGAAGNRPTP